MKVVFSGAGAAAPQMLFDIPEYPLYEYTSLPKQCFCFLTIYLLLMPAYLKMILFYLQHFSSLTTTGLDEYNYTQEKHFYSDTGSSELFSIDVKFNHFLHQPFTVDVKHS